MALASYGTPHQLGLFRDLVRTTDDGGFIVERIDWNALAKAAGPGAGDDRRPRRPGGQRPGSARGGDARPGPVDLRRGRRPVDPHHGRRDGAQLCRQRPRSRPRARTSGCGCSPPPATPEPRSGRPCTSPGERSRSPAPTWVAGWSDDELEAELQRAALPYTRPGLDRRRGRAGAGRQRDRRLVSGPQRVRAASARATGRCWRIPATGTPDPDERRQGPGAVPADRADGPRRAVRRDLRRGLPEPVHAVRASGEGRLEGPHPGGGARRRHRPGADRGRCDRAAGGRDAGRVRTAHRPAGGGQHVAEHGRAADGRHPARGDGTVRVGAGRPAGAGPVRGAPVGGLRDGAGEGRRRGADRSAGRASSALLGALAGPDRWRSARRRPAGRPVPLPDPTVPKVRRPARGPAAARNLGWRGARRRLGRVPRRRRAARPRLARPPRPPTWPRPVPTSAACRAGCASRCRPAGRPTDWERVTAGLADGEWITADMAYRRAALAQAGGFDERLPRAFREDAELAYRVRRGGLATDPRRAATVTHPVRPESRWVSVRTQRGNADDALLRRLYGPAWRDRLGLPPGRRSRHVAVTAAGRACWPPAWPPAAPPATGRGGWPLVWAAGTAEFAARPDRARPARPRRGCDHARHQRAHPAGGHRPLAAAAGSAAAGNSRSRCTPGGVPRSFGDGAVRRGAVRPRRHAGRRRALQRRSGARPAHAGCGLRRAAAPGGRAPDRGGHQSVRPGPWPVHRRSAGRGERPRGRTSRPVRHLAGLPARRPQRLPLPETGARAHREGGRRPRHHARPLRRDRRHRPRHGTRPRRPARPASWCPRP